MEEPDEIIPLDPPPEQPWLSGEELEQRILHLTGNHALWNRIEIRLADVLDAFNDLDEPFAEHELDALQSLTLTALGALHPDQPPGYEPIPERMLARHDAWLSEVDPDESFPDYAARIFRESRQPALCEATLQMLEELERNARSEVRPEKMESFVTCLAAAVWEVAHWPPNLKNDGSET